MSKPSDDYPYGQVLQTWDIDRYHIAMIAKRGTPRPDFHGWVDGEHTRHLWESLDAALVGCIAYAHEGPNHHADAYFMKMLGQ